MEFFKQIKHIKHIYQPTGNSCGPTCIKMVHDFLHYHEDRIPYSVDKISEICGTDWIVGTPPDRLEKGLKELEFNYLEHKSMSKPYEFLRDKLKTGNIAILRTITEGVPHWIIASKAFKDSFSIQDPWKGDIIYTDEELEKIWKIRDYQFFEIIIPLKRYTYLSGIIV